MDGDTRSTVWTDHFSSGSVDDLERGLTEVLRLQAERVRDDMTVLKNMEIEDPKDKMKMETRVDRNLDRVFKNGMALRATKVPTQRSGRFIPSEQLPAEPSPRMIASAFEQMEQEAIEAGRFFDRGAVNANQVWDWLADRNEVQPRPQSMKELEF